MSILQQQDSFCNLKDWNVYNSDPTAVMAPRDSGLGFYELEFSQYTNYVYNEVGITNKTRFTILPGYTSRWVFRYFHTDEVPQNHCQMWIGMTDNTNLVYTGNNVAYHYIHRSNTLPLPYSWVKAYDSGFEVGNSPFTHEEFYEMRIVCQQDGGLEYKIKGGPEYPQWHSMHFKEYNKVWNGKVNVGGCINCRKVWDQNDIERKVLVSHWALAENESDLIDFDPGVTPPPPGVTYNVSITGQVTVSDDTNLTGDLTTVLTKV